jgi:DNA adenine methylase
VAVRNQRCAVEMLEASEDEYSNDQVLKRLPSVPWSRTPRPFVKWAGGKGQLLGSLEKYFPEYFSTYYEPFLGGGAVFFYLVSIRPPFSAVLSDINEELITTYRVVKDNVEELIRLLKTHKANYKQSPKDYYYEIREKESSKEVERAARLIFLNRTCYNGLYRVNKEDKFNVPFGRYKNPKICDEANLRAVSQVLNLTKARLFAADYQVATETAVNGDFIYFDPPYQPVSPTANFTSYTDSGFSVEEQRRLGTLFRELDRRGCYVLLSNSNAEEIRNIYAGYHTKEVQALRAINCKGNGRTGHTELIIKSRDFGQAQ